MSAVPNSTLMLKGKGLGDSTVRDRVLGLLSRSGITADRVRLAGHTKTTPEHLSLYHEMDIALDPLPYHGTTTTCEAMWMGVPVITLAGDVHANRVGVSLIETVGLSALIAHSEDQYVSITSALAKDSSRRAELRRTLRDRMRSSPLCDAPAYTRRLESAYRSMWTAWCSTPAPKGLLGKLWGRGGS
jgi:predicted O-linked N-acetylglucosamine transferase (SPINDLY family)